MEKGSANQYYRDELSQKFDLIDTSAFEKIGDKYSDIKITYNTTPTSEKFVIYFPEKKGMAVERRVTYEYVYDPALSGKGNWVIHHQKNTALRDNFGKIAYTDDVFKVLKHFRQTASAARSLKRTIDKEQMNERKLTKAELDKREDIIKDMKGNKRSLVKRYGKDAEKVMYGRATNMAKKKTDENMDQKAKIREMVKTALSTPQTTTEEFTDKHDKNPALKGGQKDLPDALQKSIIDKSVKEEEETVTEDIDLGHEDNEPGMLKSDLYRIGKYAMELYQIMDKLDDGQEIDLPHWWQAKVIKAKDALVSAKHFLDFELKEPQIDQVTDMVDAKGQKYAIDEDIKEKIAEMIKGAHSVMGDKSKKKKRPSKKDIKLAKDTQADYEKSKEEEEDYEGLAARSGASLEEMGQNDPILMRQRAAKIKREKAALKPKPPRKPSFDKVLDLRAQKPELEDEIAQLKRDMEQEAEAEGGEIANRYGVELEKLEAKLAKIDKALDAYDLYESIKESKKSTTSTIAEKLAKHLKEAKKYTNKNNIVKKSSSKNSYAVVDNDDKELESRLTLDDAKEVIKDLNKESLEEVKIDYDFSEEELKRVIKQLKRGASTEVEMIKAFEKALGRELTDDEIRGFKLNEAKAPKTEDELKAAIEDAERKIEKHTESLAKIDSAPGGGNWSSSSAEGKKSRKLKDAQGKLRDKIDTYTKKLKKLK